MLQKAGADMWHLRNPVNVSGMRLAMKFPEYDAVFGRSYFIRSGSWIDIANDNRRFWNEVPSDKLLRQHVKPVVHGNWVDPAVRDGPADPHDLRRDDARERLGRRPGRPDDVERRRRGLPLEPRQQRRSRTRLDRARRFHSRARRRDRPRPRRASSGRSRVERGGAAGRDEEFGRDPTDDGTDRHAALLRRGARPADRRHDGGGRRDSRAQVVDQDGNPIPRLYEAGELGSMFCNLYQTGSMLTEAMVFGRSPAATPPASARGARSASCPKRGATELAPWPPPSTARAARGPDDRVPGRGASP